MNQTMTAEQLEELKRLAKLPSDSPTATILASLARRVIAAEKLAGVVNLYLGGASSNMQLQRALTTYRGASTSAEQHHRIEQPEAQAEIDRLTKERDDAIVSAEFFKAEVKLRNRIPSTNDTAASLQVEVERLSELLSDKLEQLDSAAERIAWNDAIEAAANLEGIEGYSNCVPRHRIRALKRKV